MQEKNGVSQALSQNPPRHAVLLAAGAGSRLRAAAGRPKPLTPVLGLTLAERAVLFFRSLGVEHITVAVGYRAAEVQSHFRQIAQRHGVVVDCVEVPDWERGNGESARVAIRRLQEQLPDAGARFWLAMTDHLFHGAVAQALLQRPLPDGAVRLAVDYRLDRLFDPQDATRVRLHKRDGELHILDIGKDIFGWQAVDTGLFLCTFGLLEALEEAAAAGQHGLSDAMRLLAQRHKALAGRIEGGWWLDVDTPEALQEAERRLLAQERGKAHDGPISRHINRPLSRLISRILSRWPITPNQITLFSFALALFAAWLMAQPGWLWLALGGLLAQVSSIIDGCDGEIARLKYQRSEFGGWLDAVLDRYADAALLFGLAWHAAAATSGNGLDGTAMLWGFLAIIGSFVNSYTADKYDGLMRQRLGAAAVQRFRLGRDVRVFLIMLGALLNMPLLALAIIAIIMNAEVLRRILLFRRAAASG